MRLKVKHSFAFRFAHLSVMPTLKLSIAHLFWRSFWFLLFHKGKNLCYSCGMLNKWDHLIYHQSHIVIKSSFHSWNSGNFVFTLFSFLYQISDWLTYVLKNIPGKMYMTYIWVVFISKVLHKRVNLRKLARKIMINVKVFFCLTLINSVVNVCGVCLKKMKLF